MEPTDDEGKESRRETGDGGEKSSWSNKME